jgi:short-subunit dehydrogenase
MKRLIIVTGSSRGIGKSIAEQFNTFYNSEALILLLARDLDALGQVKNDLILKSNNSNRVEAVQVDFSVQRTVSDYVKILEEAIKETDLSQFEELYVVYNHATLEYVTNSKTGSV